MSIDASAVARVLGISTTFKDFREGNALFLPQRIAIFAQGQDGVSYSLDKWLATGLPAAGTRFGFKSPIYLTLFSLLPYVGTIPVTVYPLPADAGGGAAAATGDITPSGNPTKGSSYRVRIGGVATRPFAIDAGNLATASVLTAACRRIGEAIREILHMPVLVTYTYGTPTSAPGGSNAGNGTLGTLTTTGNPLPGDWTLVCTAAAADAGTFTLTDPLGTVISTTVTVGAQIQGGLGFTLTDGSSDFQPGDTFTITVPATKVDLTAGWKGVTGNDIVIEILPVGDALVNFAITQPSGGLVNPTVDSALQQVGSTWETLALNALNIEDETALDAYQAFGEARWDPLVQKPLVVFTGNTKEALQDATAVCSTRRDDRVNSQLPAPASPNLPCMVAARKLAEIALVANNNPPTGYGALRATGIVPGADGVQWNETTRDQAVKLGSSTSEVVDGVVEISDVVTFYRPEGEEPPGYRQVRDIVKLQNVIFNVRLVFAASEWASAPLIPDSQPTINANARKPSSAKAAIGGVLEGLGLQAIIADAAAAKRATTVAIDSGNPNRLNMKVPFAISSNTDIKNVELEFGLFFGNAAA